MRASQNGRTIAMETTTGLNKQTFAAFIAAKRKAAGMTQEELARQLYVTHTTVSKWERGLSYPDIALVPEVCRLLGITEHEFFTGRSGTRSIGGG